MAQSISGVITGPAAKPIANAQVVATNAANQASPAVASDANGNYAIPGLADGAYTVSVVAPSGFQNPAPQVNVQVAAPNDTQGINFQLASISISGSVFKDNNPLQNATVTSTDKNGAAVNVNTDNQGNYSFPNLPAGAYIVEVTAPKPNDYVAAHNVIVIDGVPAIGIDFSSDIVDDFLRRIDDARFSVESPVSIDEANQAVGLFSVSTMMLAGLGKRKVGNVEKTDILGVLNLYYGLQDNSLQDKITVADSTVLWGSLETRLKSLAQDLDSLQSDVDFLTREAKRQFNLGTTNGVLANVQFPSLFKRYVEIGTDPLLSFDLLKQESNDFFDKTKLGQAYDLLKELKGLILQIVRSLSKYGTAATKRVNEDWASFESRSLEVVATVAQQRVSSDQDEKNQWSVLAQLLSKNRETEVAPFVVLARHGGKLLRYAMDIYKLTQNNLDNFDQVHLRDLFQPKNQVFWTDKIRAEATVIKRYPLPNWG